jgi:hypothetical protein
VACLHDPAHDLQGFLIKEIKGNGMFSRADNKGNNLFIGPGYILFTHVIFLTLEVNAAAMIPLTREYRQKQLHHLSQKKKKGTKTGGGKAASTFQGRDGCLRGGQNYSL